MKEILRTDKYILKTFSMENFDLFTELNMDNSISRYVNHDPNEKGKTFRECVEKFQEIVDMQNKYGFSYWAVYLIDGTFIGQCGLTEEYRNNILNFCYMYKKEYWGKGIGTEVARIMLDYCYKNFEEIFKEKKVRAMSFTLNIASVKLLKKIGFEYTKSMEEFGKELQFFELNKENFYKCLENK